MHLFRLMKQKKIYLIQPISFEDMHVEEADKKTNTYTDEQNLFGNFSSLALSCNDAR